MAAPQTASTATTADSRSLGLASTDGSTVTEERVNFARWRHVDDDTAARFIEALDAMDGATEPMESDSDMNVKSLDSDKDVTSGLQARSKRLEHSVSDTDSFRATRNTERMESIRRGVEQSKAGEVTRYPAGHFRQAYIDTYGVAPEDDEDSSREDAALGQRDVTQSHFVPTSVTITISREAAKKVADWPDDERYPFSAELGKAARAALEEER